MKLFGREPALILAAIAAVIQFLSAFFLHWDTDTQGVVNAVVLAAFGVFTSIAVKGVDLVPTLVGFFKALIALGLAFGLHLAPEAQASILLLVQALGAGFIRTQVTPKVPAGGSVTVARVVP